MLKKYLPFIVLLAAAGLFVYIKMHQRGPAANKINTELANDRITVPAMLPQGNDTIGEEGFSRRTVRLFYSRHARCRMECRHIDESEVKEILEKGTINYSKIEEDGRGKTYPLEGITHDRQHVRIVFTPKDDGMLVVTCVDLDTEWPCDCK